jgi:MFS family permease
MLTSISPLGERARGNRFGVTATAHIIGSAVGGALVGGLAGAVGWLLLDPFGPNAATVIALAVLAGAIATAALLDRRGTPTVRRQVDERWLGAYRGWAYGFGYGVQLGMGVVTIVPSALVYAAIAGAGATAAPAAGAVVGAAFGAGRGLGILLGARVRTPQELAGLHRRVVAAGPRAARVARTAAASLGAFALVAAVGVGVGA